MTEIDWKEKYRLLAEQQGIDEAEQAEIEALLCRTISRLTLAASGLNPSLDPKLKSIRSAVHKGVNPELKATLETLLEALMHVSEQKPGVGAAASSPDLLQRLLNRIKLVGKPAVQLNKLVEQLRADPANASDAQLDELLTLIAPRKGAAVDGPVKSGLFG